MSPIQILRSLVNERLAAAAEEIFGLFERTIIEYEGEIDRQRKLMDVVKPEMTTASGSPRLLVLQEEVSSEQKKKSSSPPFALELPGVGEQTLDPISVKKQNGGGSTQCSQLSQKDPELLQIKEEQEELFRHLNEADGSMMTSHPVRSRNGTEKTETSQLRQKDPKFHHIKEEPLQVLEEAGSKISELPLKCEDGQENLLPFQPLQTQKEETTEAEPLPRTSSDQIEAEPDGEDCGASEPASNLDPAGGLEQLFSSECSAAEIQNRNEDLNDQGSSDGSGTETDDSDDWKEVRQPKSGLRTLKPKKIQERQDLFKSKALDLSVDSPDSLKSFPLTQYIFCKVCRRCFPDKVTLNRHVKIHSRACGVCGKQLQSTEGLKRHFETHRICPVCCEVLNENIDFYTHLRSHNGGRPFSCSVCGKEFGKKRDLQRHVRTHTGERPYKCSLCSRSFCDSGNLKRHSRTHSNEKPFSCSICGKGFSRKGALKGHMVSHNRKIRTEEICTDTHERI